MEQTGDRQKKLALLIDCDNVSIQKLGALIEEATQDGVVTIRHGYADWTALNIQNTWTRDIMSRHAITPIQQFRQKGKNSSDIALVVDAMDILYGGTVDGFCIFSSDGDYVRLVHRLREAGKYVIGFGEKKSSEHLVNAFDRFVYIENLTGDNEKGADADKSPAREKGLTRQQTGELRNAIGRVVSPDDDGILLSVLGSKLRQNNPAFDQRTYGYKSLTELVQNFVKQSNVKWSLTKQNGQRYLERK